MAGSVTIQERIENKGFPAAFGSRRRRIGSIIRIEYARLAGLLGLGIGGRPPPRGVGLPRCLRRAGQAALSPAHPPPQPRPAQKDKCPSPNPPGLPTIPPKIPPP